METYIPPRKGPDGKLRPIRTPKWRGKDKLPRKLPKEYTDTGLCVGYRAGIYDEKQDGNVHWSEAGYGDRGKRPEGIKRMRLRCPRCGRRVLSSVRTCHDGCCVHHDIPPHKPKGWWKKAAS